MNASFLADTTKSLNHEDSFIIAANAPHAVLLVSRLYNWFALNKFPNLIVRHSAALCKCGRLASVPVPKLGSALVEPPGALAGRK